MISAEEKVLQETLLTEAYKNYGQGLAGHAFGKLSNSETSEDLIQDTFLKTWKYLMRGGRVETMKAFLHHVLDDCIIDEYRKHKAISLDLLLEKGFELSVNQSNRLFAMLDSKQALQLLQRLPKNYKSIIYMRYIQELSLSEMSAITGQSKNTVAVQVHRGLQKLKLLYDTLLKPKKHV